MTSSRGTQFFRRKTWPFPSGWLLDGLISFTNSRQTVVDAMPFSGSSLFFPRGHSNVGIWMSNAQFITYFIYYLVGIYYLNMNQWRFNGDLLYYHIDILHLHGDYVNKCNFLDPLSISRTGWQKVSAKGPGHIPSLIGYYMDWLVVWIIVYFP